MSRGYFLSYNRDHWSPECHTNEFMSRNFFARFIAFLYYGRSFLACWVCIFMGSIRGVKQLYREFVYSTHIGFGDRIFKSVLFFNNSVILLPIMSIFVLCVTVKRGYCLEIHRDLLDGCNIS